MGLFMILNVNRLNRFILRDMRALTPLVMGQVPMEQWEKTPCCRQSQRRVTCNLK